MAVALLSPGLGLASVSVADAASRNGSSYTKASVFFWFGLLLMFVPIAATALARGTRRRERLLLLLLLGVAFYVVKILYSPDNFGFGDEYIQLRSTQDILRTQHLFAPNPLLPTASYYPGLPALTAGLMDITGLSPFTCGLVIIGAARALISVSVFFVAERVTKSDRSAAAASLLYAANPMFLFWSAAFSYEDLALPLAAFAVWWLGKTRHETHRLPWSVTAVTILAVTVTHHVAGLALAALLAAWWLAERLTVGRNRRLPELGAMTLLAGATSLAWLFLVARPAAHYLFTDNLFPAFRRLGSLLSGHAAPRKLYSSGGYVSPHWQTFLGFLAVILILAALPPALYYGWRRPRRAPLLVAMATAAAYPLSLLPRLTTVGVAISGRSSEYLFAGLGCVLGLLVITPHRTRRRHTVHRKRFTAASLLTTALATAVLTTILVGDVTIGTAFYQQLPEATDPRGYPWSLQADVITASKWTLHHLGNNQRFGSDAIDALALASYGDQDPIPGDTVWPIFFADQMNESVVRQIQRAHLRYVLLDWRMTKGVPATPGYYFSPAEPGAGRYAKAFPPVGLEKFDSTNCDTLVYSAGPIQIFNISRIETGSCIPKAARSARLKGATQ